MKAEKEARAAEREPSEAEEHAERTAHAPAPKKERGRSENLDPEIERHVTDGRHRTEGDRD